MVIGFLLLFYVIFNNDRFEIVINNYVLGYNFFFIYYPLFLLLVYSLLEYFCQINRLRMYKIIIFYFNLAILYYAAYH